ncbi:hypothetical protein [Zavarzinia sp.]|uniref:hypothetical protein n=1 Tax=Zavarzinia sp. TaxID=2027920 RepID=UPI00356A45EE
MFDPTRSTPPTLAQSERRREALAALVAAIVRNVQDGILIVEEGGRIASLNGALARMAGIDEAAAVGHPASSLIGWNGEQAETRTALDCDLTLHTAAGRQVLKAVILPVERESGRFWRLVVLQRPSEQRAVPILNEFERRVVAALRTHADGGPPPGASGQVEVIMLDAVKQRLGPRWRIISERVMTLATTMINQRLGSGETFARIADSSFVVSFLGATRDEAASRARAIANDITQQLLGDAEAAEGFVVRGSAEPVPETAELAPVQAPAAPLDPRLEASRRDFDSKVQAVAADVLRDARLEPRQVRRQGGQPSGLMLGALDNASLNRIAWLQRAGAQTPAVGLLVLTRVIELLYRTLGSLDQVPPVYLVPLPFATLNDRAGMEQFLALARPLPPALRQQMIFVLTELPRDLVRQRQAEVAQRLAPFCRRVGLGIADLDDSFVAYEEVHPTGLMIPWSADLSAQMQRDGDRLRKLIAHAHQNRCRVLIDRVADEAERQWLDQEFGIDLAVDSPAAGP